VWDNERVVLIPDHYIFAADPRADRNVDILREMAAGSTTSRSFTTSTTGEGSSA
jgi:hypothetical protein